MTTTHTIHDIGNLVRALAVATRDTEIRPHEASNLVKPALLVQLRAAIVPDGASGGGGKAAHERIVLNTAALDLYDYVDGRIQLLYDQMTGERKKGSPEEVLTSWYVKLAIEEAQGDVVDAQLERLWSTIDDIRTRIMDMFHPPERGDILDRGRHVPCPECGWTTVTIPGADGPVRKGALVQLAREWKGESSVRCRQCNHTWTGEDEMRELAFYAGLPTPAPLRDWDRIHNRPADVYTPPEDLVARPLTPEG